MTFIGRPRPNSRGRTAPRQGGIEAFRQRRERGGGRDLRHLGRCLKRPERERGLVPGAGLGALENLVRPPPSVRSQVLRC